MEYKAAAVFSAEAPTLDPALLLLSQDPLLLCTKAQLLEYLDTFVDDFLGLAQGPTHWRRHLRRTLLHALDKVFRTFEKLDPT